MFSLGRMFNPESTVVPFEFDETIKSEEIDGKMVVVYEKVSPPDHVASFHDLDIQTFIDAGLIDKLSEGKPIKMSLLDRQDAIYNEVDIVEKLHLEAQIAERRAQRLAALENDSSVQSPVKSPDQAFDQSSEQPSDKK